MDKNKIDTQTVYEMFEEIGKKLDKQTNTPTEPTKPVQAEVDMTAINTVTERLETMIEESTVEHRHHYTIDIRSNWFFLSWVALAIVVLGLFWAIANQRQTISQYREGDLKYRYIRMQGQTDEENIYRLEQQFQYGDSIKLIRKQVEKYEELVKEQAEKLERARRDSEEAERLENEVKELKKTK